MSSGNLCQVHNFNIKHVKKQRPVLLKNLNNRLARVKWIAENAQIHEDKKKATDEISELQRVVHDIKVRKLDLVHYLLLSLSIVEEYSAALKDGNARQIEEKALQFKILTEKYSSVNVSVSIVEQKTVCECKNTVQEDGTEICSECGIICNKFDTAQTYNDSRADMSTRYMYSKDKNFSRALDRYQARQTVKISSKVYTVIRNEMKRLNFTEQTLTKDALYNILTNNSLGKYYDHLNLIFCEITGTSAPCLDAYIETIKEMSSAIDKVYNEASAEIYNIGNKERKNSMNVVYKLYKILQLLDYDCSKDDFYMLRTVEKLEEHESAWKCVCEMLRWKYIPSK